MPTWRDIHDTRNLVSIDDLRSLASYAIQSQYSASPKMGKLITSFQGRLSPYDEIDLFFNKIFDIYTAEGYGLDNWGRILDINRVVEDADTGVSYRLEDEPYRLLLLYKALANISSADAETLNRLLSELINTGIGSFNPVAYVLEVDVMVIRWVFESFLTGEQKAIFKVAGILAKGAGVGWQLYAIDPSKVFGFDGSRMNPFNQAPFAPDDALIYGVN